MSPPDYVSSVESSYCVLTIKLVNITRFHAFSFSPCLRFVFINECVRCSALYLVNKTLLVTDMCWADNIIFITQHTVCSLLPSVSSLQPFINLEAAIFNNYYSWISVWTIYRLGQHCLKFWPWIYYTTQITDNWTF